MSYLIDTKRCPYCGGDMLVVEHMASGSKECECAACGTEEVWDFKGGNSVHKLSRPTAYITLVTNDDLEQFRYFGKHPFKWLNKVKHNPKCIPLIKARRMRGVVYNKKHQKVITVFGTKPEIHPDSYYEPDDFI